MRIPSSIQFLGRRPSYAVVGLMALALMGGCGGGDEVVRNSPSITKQEFIDQADQICYRTGEKQYRKISLFDKRYPVEKMSKPEIVTAQMKQVILPLIDSEIAQIRHLDAPNGDKSRIDAILTAEQGAVNRLRRLPEIKSIAQFERYFLKPSSLAREYGYLGCGHSRHLENTMSLEDRASDG